MRGFMYLKDTLTGEYVKLDRNENPTVRMYVCGITVYDYCHLGHARTIIVFDVLRRLLKAKGFSLLHAQNFTDLDDKIIKRAREMGVSVKDVAEMYIKAYFEDFDRLNVERVEFYPRATEHIPSMHEIIKGLIEKGYAYVTDTGVYFDITKFKGYGKLSKVKVEELKAGARVEVDEHKRSPLDFALWKFANEGPLYPSPWGLGRPGWHIECSSMVWRLLGETIEIHGGGEDLIFPHHENEIAQSEAFTDKPLSKIWMHVGMLKLGADKMSKSLGNIITIRDAIPKWGPNTIRLFLLMKHYRAQLNLTEEGLRKAAENWKIIEGAAWDLLQPYGKEGDERLIQEARAYFDEFDENLSRDLNTPAAIMVLLEFSKAVARAQANMRLDGRTAGEVGGYFFKMFDILGFKLPEVSEDEREYIERLVKRRKELRMEGRYGEADEIRNELRARKVLLIDVGPETYWRKVENL